MCNRRQLAVTAASRCQPGCVERSSDSRRYETDLGTSRIVTSQRGAGGAPLISITRPAGRVVMDQPSQDGLLIDHADTLARCKTHAPDMRIIVRQLPPISSTLRRGEHHLPQVAASEGASALIGLAAPRCLGHGAFAAASGSSVAVRQWRNVGLRCRSGRLVTPRAAPLGRRCRAFAAV